MAAAAVAFAPAALAQAPGGYDTPVLSGQTANPSALTTAYYGQNQAGAPAFTTQGAYFGAVQGSSSQAVALTIEPFSHVQLLNEGDATLTVDPGGSGNNQVQYNNVLRYGTNRAVSEDNEVLVNVLSPNGSADFDELNFLVRTRLFGTNTVNVLDIAQGGSAGYFHGAYGAFNYGNYGTNERLFIQQFGQVVAEVPIRYDITVSDVAVQGDRDFDVTFTINGGGSEIPL